MEAVGVGTAAVPTGRPSASSKHRSVYAFRNPLIENQCTSGGRAMNRLIVVALVVISGQSGVVAQQGDASRGRQAFRACAACHSLGPGRNMTGPSLAGLWGRK